MQHPACLEKGTGTLFGGMVLGWGWVRAVGRAVEPWCEAGAVRCRGWRQQGQKEMERAVWERLDGETCNALAFLCYL